MQTDFFKSVVWRDIEGILVEQIEHDRDALEQSNDLNAIIELQAAIGEKRVLLDMENTLEQRTKPLEEDA